MTSSRLSIALLLLSAFAASGFTLSQQQTDRSTATTLAAGRRDFFNQGAASFAAVGATIVTGSLPALADVSDGNALPQGAQQFSRLIRVKGDLKVCCVVLV